MTRDEPLAVLRCWKCQGGGCRRCDSTGSVFWVEGYAYPYTQEGEKAARKVIATLTTSTQQGDGK